MIDFRGLLYAGMFIGAFLVALLWLAVAITPWVLLPPTLGFGILCAVERYRSHREAKRERPAVDREIQKQREYREYMRRRGIPLVGD